MLQALSDLLFSPELLLALLWYVAGSLIAVWLLSVGERWLHGVTISHWILVHMLFPAAQAVLLLVFLLILRDPLFGIETPPIDALFSRPGQFSSLVNWLVVLSVAGAMVPAIGRHLEWIIPVQGMLMLAMLFHRMAVLFGVPEHGYWPGWGTMVQVILLIIVGAFLSRRLTGLLALFIRNRWRISDGTILAGPVIALLLQLPPLSYYGHMLIANSQRGIASSCVHAHSTQ